MDYGAAQEAVIIAFAWPWLFFVLPMPWLVRRVLPASAPAQDAALRVPFLEDFAPQESRRSRPTNRWPLWVAATAWCLLVIAAARPQWLGEPIEQAVSGRDLMLAIDLSGSMQEQDFFIHGRKVDRLTAAQWVAGQFIEQRAGDRIGLILFGDQAYLQTPLTFDRKTVTSLLNEAAIGLAGNNTAIGDAIGLAVKRLRKNPSDQRVLILMTDGANTAGVVSPIKAAELAASEGLKIYTIGIGADEMIISNFFGTRRVNPSADLDEATLKRIAELTEGRYFRARDTQELSTIYALLDQLEPVEKEKQYFRPKQPLFMWPLAAAVLLIVVPAGAKLQGRLNP